MLTHQGVSCSSESEEMTGDVLKTAHPHSSRLSELQNVTVQLESSGVTVMLIFQTVTTITSWMLGLCHLCYLSCHCWLLLKKLKRTRKWINKRWWNICKIHPLPPSEVQALRGGTDPSLFLSFCSPALNRTKLLKQSNEKWLLHIHSLLLTLTGTLTWNSQARLASLL